MEAETTLKNILIITTWSFHDGLVQSAVIPHLKMIKSINANLQFHIVTSENEISKLPLLDDFNILQFKQRKFGLKKLLQFPARLLKLYFFIKTKKIDCIHCFCTPAGMEGSILSKLTGKPLIIDSYEPHAEAMVENGAWEAGSLPFKVLFWFEKFQTKHASALIACTASMKEYAAKKYNYTPPHLFVKPACVDLNQFYFSDELRNKQRALLGFSDEKVVCIYVGKLGGIYLEKEVFDFLKVASQYFGSSFRFLMVTSVIEELIVNLAKQAGIPDGIVAVVAAKHSEVNQYLNAADFAITPVKPVPSKRYCSPIKDGEYWATGLPVVITKDISDDSQIIEEHNIGAVIASLRQADYITAIKKVEALLEANKQQELGSKIRKVAERYRSFAIAEEVYRKLYGADGIYKL